MITIDKLCYHSKLRYCNAAEKFAFSVLTILFCVVSRSAVIAGIVLLTTGILTVWKGGRSAAGHRRPPAGHRREAWKQRRGGGRP